MILTGNLGFPRIGANRELKFALEKYWKGNITSDDLQQTASEIQNSNWKLQREIGLDIIPSNDFSFYDHVLDTTILLGAIPERFEQLRDRSSLDLYFSLARGYQTAQGQAVPALEMTKWFNTNYHFLVPEIDAHTQFRLNPAKPLEAYQFARSLGITTRPVILGPWTYLLLSKSSQPGFSSLSRLPEVIDLYDQLFALMSDQTIGWLQLDEPALSTDLSPEGLRLIDNSSSIILASRSGPGSC
jgi:5-methyltetrahydropteroyltriglutamate--homocysteine methyltransferase